MFSTSKLPQLIVFGEKKQFSPRYIAGKNPQGFFNSNKPERVFNLADLIKELNNDNLTCARIGDLQWLTSELTHRIGQDIYKKLEGTMQAKKHHTTLHAEIMGLYAKHVMMALGQPEGLQNLAYLIGISHDVVQDLGWKQNEFKSAQTLLEEINRYPESKRFSPRANECVQKFIFQSICSFTTLDFTRLQTFGEIAIPSNHTNGFRYGNKTDLLIQFGCQLAHNDLFSKIDFFGKPENFEKIGNREHSLNSEKCKVVMLIVQMYQVNAEFNSSLVYAIDNASPQEKGNALLNLVGHETREDQGFWREGMPPSQTMKHILGCNEEYPLYDLLQSNLSDESVLSAVCKTITFLNELGNPSYEKLVEIEVALPDRR